ncbi:MAG: hypothetical protein QXO71_07800 [Candidatus Jordarchaeaceae archaeon]
MTNLDKNNAREVNCVRDEYLYIFQQSCEKCRRKNAYKLCTQTLINNENRDYDILETKCQYCGHIKYFTFDVTECLHNIEKQLYSTFKDKETYEDLDWDSET